MTGEKKITKQEQEPATDEITEIAPGVLRTQLPVELPGLGHVNCYLLEDERGVAVVDPGLPGPTSWNALLDRLARAGFELRHVHTAVVTHSHFDHFGGAPQLRSEAGTEILTHDSFREHFDERELFEDHDSAVLELNPADELDRIRELMRRPKPWGGHWSPPTDDDLRVFLKMGRRSRRFRVPDPSITIADSQVVRLARREWVAVHTPGHTSDHLCLYDPVEKLFLSGDHVLPTITPHIAGHSPGGVIVDPLARFFESLQRMHEFDVTWCYRRTGTPSRISQAALTTSSNTTTGGSTSSVIVPMTCPRARWPTTCAACFANAHGRHGRERDFRAPRASATRRRGDNRRPRRHARVPHRRLSRSAAPIQLRQG